MIGANHFKKLLDSSFDFQHFMIINLNGVAPIVIGKIIPIGFQVLINAENSSYIGCTESSTRTKQQFPVAIRSLRNICCGRNGLCRSRNA